MVKRKTNTKDFEDWLKELEAKIGQPIVVSLSIERGDISFLSAVDRDRYLREEPEDDEEEPGIPLSHFKPKGLDYNYQGYIQ